MIGWLTLVISFVFSLSLNDNVQVEAELWNQNEEEEIEENIDPILLNPEFTSSGLKIHEGDILYAEDLLTDEGRQAIYQPDCRRWPEGKVLYYRDSSMTDFTFDVLKRAMELWEKVSCLTFHNVSEGAGVPYITYQSDVGCYSHVGRICWKNGTNLLGLQSGCDTTLGTPAHELGHSIGIFHTHTRYDRDKYVRINEDNIVSGKEHNFEKKTNITTNNFGVSYEFCSVMHYPSHAFSVNGLPTIERVDSTNNDPMGQRDGLSFTDIKLANLMYNCADHCPKNLYCDDPCFLNKNCTCTCNGYAVRSTCSAFTPSKCPIEVPPNVINPPKATKKPTSRPSWKPTKKCDSLVILGGKKRVWSFENKNKIRQICTTKIQGQKGKRVEAKLISAKLLPQKNSCKNNYFQSNVTGKPEFKNLKKNCGNLPKKKKQFVIKSKGNSLFLRFRLHGDKKKVTFKVKLSSFGSV